MSPFLDEIQLTMVQIDPATIPPSTIPSSTLRDLIPMDTYMKRLYAVCVRYSLEERKKFAMVERQDNDKAKERCRLEAEKLKARRNIVVALFFFEMMQRNILFASKRNPAVSKDWQIGWSPELEEIETKTPALCIGAP